jgi:cytochrome c-type biogenesis protein CcmH/NrfF
MGKAYKKNKMEEAADKIIAASNLPDASDIRKDVKKKMSGGMAIGGGHKNYKMTGMMTAKYGKMAKAK